VNDKPWANNEVALIEHARKLSRGQNAPSDVQEVLWLLATALSDRRRDLRFFIGQVGAAAELAKRNLGDEGQ
jgi:hypothetical protein